eukprot:m.27050 g.27050  ORF g.27050 m.27050 type:complete len:314 (+) comp7857_c0_seq1:383-1324(+)
MWRQQLNQILNSQRKNLKIPKKIWRGAPLVDTNHFSPKAVFGTGNIFSKRSRNNQALADPKIIAVGETTSFSFSGAGFLSLFHVGAATRLKELNVISTKTQLYGCSGGALAAASVIAEIPVDDVIEFHLETMRHCQKHGYFGNVGKVLYELLDRNLPSNAPEIFNKRLGVGVLSVWPMSGFEIVNEFKDKRDLIDALMATCHIPFYLEPRFCTKYRGKYVIDGGMNTQLNPMPGIEVHPFSVSPKRIISKCDTAVCPIFLDDYPNMLKQCQWVFGLNMNESHHRYLYMAGRKAADAWYQKFVLDEEEAISSTN